MRAGLRVITVIILALAVVSCASDDKPKVRRWNPNGAPQGTQDWHSPVAMLVKYDTDHDGDVTRKELEAGLKADFDAADKKHTGCLDSEEVTEINEERMKYDESAASPLIDWKNKGCIDLDEFATTARSLFLQLDTDGDGVLSANELHPKKPGKKKPPPTVLPPSGGGY
jgi:Ca2+-binding EF-hand superfamily protein